MNSALTVFMPVLALVAGTWLIAGLDSAARPPPRGALAAGRLARSLTHPLYRSLALIRQQAITTERPDRLTWRLAPMLYFSLALIALGLVPFVENRALIQTEAGIVVWGTLEAFTVVAIFLHGWSSNSLLPLIGGYRFVAIGLTIMLVSMFVLIAVALPAQSLSIQAVVESQRGLWNVVRQPLGLPLFLLLGLALGLRGPFDYADSADLAGGTSVEDSGTLRAAWQLARAAMLVAFAAMASAVFLGGPLGPWLPGPVWMGLKMAVLLVVLVAAGRVFARFDPARMLTLVWVLLLPLAFLDLAISGLASLP